MIEVTIVMRVDHYEDVPTEDDIEVALDCICISVNEEEV